MPLTPATTGHATAAPISTRPGNDRNRVSAATVAGPISPKNVAALPSSQYR